MRLALLLFLFFGGLINAQQGEKVDLSSPSATIHTHIYFLMPETYDEEKSAATIWGLKGEQARDVARKIKEIYDGNGLIVDFSKIPDDPNYLDTVDFGSRSLENNKNKFAPFPVRMPEIYVEKIGSSWYYSKQTISGLDELYKDTFPLRITALKDRFPSLFSKSIFGILIWKPITLILALIICVILYYLLEPIFFFILKYVQKLFFKKSKGEQVLSVLHELARPIVFIVILRVIKTILPSFQLVKLNALLLTGIRIAETVFWIMIFLKLSKVILHLYRDYNKKERSKLDRQLAPLINKLIQGIIVLIGFLHILTAFGVDPATVLAGASIGGIAVAFAAQDSVKNLIGAMVIFMDKPFQLDDWVEIGGIEGAVEKVGFRSTKLRAADTTLYQIPNSKISEADINNKGLRIFRRYSTELGVRYDTPPELIEAFIDGIKQLIALHPSTKSQSYNVEFIAFGDSALKILVNVYFKGLDWGEEQASKHILHLAIVKLAASLGVEFAFPSTTLMIEQLPGKESLAPKYNTDAKVIKENIDKIMKDFEKSDHTMDPYASTERGG